MIGKILGGQGDTCYFDFGLVVIFLVRILRALEEAGKQASEEGLCLVEVGLERIRIESYVHQLRLPRPRPRRGRKVALMVANAVAG